MQPVALVTGASSGIGETFARQLAARGYRLILVARRADRLQTLAQSLGSAEVLPADLTDPLQLHRVCDRIANEPHFALLVNNAGFGSKRRFWEADLEGQRQMHLLHVNAVVDLSHAALRVMTPRNQGAVINVASVAGFARSPSNVSYCATKAG